MIQSPSGKRDIISLIVIFSLCVTLLNFSIPYAKAGSGGFLEEFTTTDWRGPTSNITGWGDGEVQLSKKTMTVLGNCTLPSNTQTRFVELDGDYAYVLGWENYLDVVNITNPYSPTWVARTVTSRYAHDFAVSDGFAYVCLGSEGLKIYDVRDPEDPHWVRNYSPGDVYGICIEGPLAYIATYQDGLHVLNVTDPTSPNLISNNSAVSETVRISIHGSLLFLRYITLSYEDGFHIVNISNPQNPVIVSSTLTPGIVEDLYAEGNYLYVTERDNLRVYNIINPMTPEEVGSLPFQGYTQHREFSIIGNYIYLPSLHGGVYLINITNPTQPTLEQRTDTDGMVYDIAVHGNVAYVTSNDNYIEVIVIRDIVSPSVVGSSPLTGGSGISLSSHYAYIADTELWIYDISDPTSPQARGDYWIDMNAVDVCVSNNIAYIADALRGLVILNVTNRYFPTQLSNISITGTASGIQRQGVLIFISDLDGGLHVFNVTDPHYPVHIDSEYTSGNTNDFFVKGLYAYLADGDSGLHIVDIHDPTNITWLGTYNTSGHSRGVVVEGGYAYVADDSSGLQVIDIFNPENPQFVSNLATTGVSLDVYSYGDYIYIADGIAGLQIVNVTDPRNPSLMGPPLSSISTTNTVYVLGDYAYVGSDSGFKIVEVMRSRVRQYATIGIAESSLVFTSANDLKLLRATLNASYSLPTDTSVTYYISPDDGVHWELVTPDIEHTFAYVGKSLKWRVLIESADWQHTPIIDSIGITFSTILNAPQNLVTFENSNYSDIRFYWDLVAGRSSYLVQIDTTASLDSTNLINVTVLPSYHDAVLENGTYYWRVAGIDSDSVLGHFSNTTELVVGTIGTPTSGPPPEPLDMTLILLIVTCFIAVAVVTFLIRARRRSS